MGEDTECGRRFLFGEQVCKRLIHRNGLHRDARRMKDAVIMWGDNECKPEEGEK